MPKFEELPLMEQLAIKQAIYNSLGKDVSTKDPDSLRGFADEQIVGNYMSMGAKSYDVSVNGSKVGTYSVKVSKGAPERRSAAFEVCDERALREWFPVDAPDMVDQWLAAHWREFAKWYFDATGDLPDGCRMAERVTPAKPERVAGTVLRIDSEKVAEAIQGYLPTPLAGLIGGGDVE